MGMFNYVEVDEKHIPKSEQCEDYQTKDEVVDLYLEVLKITASGRLLHHHHTRKVELSDESIFGFWLKSVHDEWIDTDYHGDLNFYGDKNGVWYEYIARFTDGQLQYIKRLEPD